MQDDDKAHVEDTQPARLPVLHARKDGHFGREAASAEVWSSTLATVGSSACFLRLHNCKGDNVDKEQVEGEDDKVALDDLAVGEVDNSENETPCAASPQCRSMEAAERAASPAASPAGSLPKAPA